MQFLRNVLINASSIINQRRWLQQEARRLKQSEGEAAAVLVRALEAVSGNDFSPEEKNLIRKIETLRKSLLVSKERIELPDYGAGAVSQQAKNGRRPQTTIGRITISSKSSFWAGLLFKLIRELRPKTCLEMGTNMGMSASYQASALQLNGAGKLITLEGSQPRARQARKNLDHLRLNNVEIVNGRFQDILPGVLKRCGPVDFVFIDGHHDEEATKKYFLEILPHASGSALFIFDDIAWSEGMKRAWQVIRNHPQVKASADLYVMGICLVGK